MWWRLRTHPILIHLLTKYLFSRANTHVYCAFDCPRSGEKNGIWKNTRICWCASQNLDGSELIYIICGSNEYHIKYAVHVYSVFSRMTLASLRISNEFIAPSNIFNLKGSDGDFPLVMKTYRRACTINENNTGLHLWVAFHHNSLLPYCDATAVSPLIASRRNRYFKILFQITIPASVHPSLSQHLFVRSLSLFLFQSSNATLLFCSKLRIDEIWRE